MFLSIAFELGALASAISITILDKISKGVTWAIFIILVLFQIIGNVYYTFEYIVKQEVMDPKYLDIASRFISYFWEFETTDETRMFLSILIGIPIPLISLAFLKTLVDYISKETVEKVETVEEVLEEDIIIEEEPVVVSEDIIKEEPVVIVDEVSVDKVEEPQIKKEETIDELKEELHKKETTIKKQEMELIKTYPQIYGTDYKSQN
jgi:hypothetical protein